MYCQNCQFVDSQLELKALVANGFWPATVRRIVHIFEIDLLKFIDMLMKNMPGTSLSSMAKALQDIDESVEYLPVLFLSGQLKKKIGCSAILVSIFFFVKSPQD